MNLFSLLGVIGASALSLRVPSAAQENAIDTSNDGVYEHVTITDSLSYDYYDNFAAQVNADLSGKYNAKHITLLHAHYPESLDRTIYESNIQNLNSFVDVELWYDSDFDSLWDDNDTLTDFDYVTVTTFRFVHRYNSQQNAHLYYIYRFDNLLLGQNFLRTPTYNYLRPYVYYMDNLNISTSELSADVVLSPSYARVPDEYGYIDLYSDYPPEYPSNPLFQMSNNYVSTYLFGYLNNAYYTSFSSVGNYYRTQTKGLVTGQWPNQVRNAWQYLGVDYTFKFSYRDYSNFDGSSADSYNLGYQDGYDDGLIDAEDIIGDRIYDDGYQDGREFGEQVGYQDGYQKALDDMAEVNTTAVTIFSGILDIGMIPINAFLTMLNFEVFGINIGGFVTGLFTIAIVVVVTRLILGGKND